jgi:hypothetical protein
MLFRKFALVLAVTLLSLQVIAQPVTVGNNFVSATVDQNSGLVSIYQGTTNLTYPGTSYLSVKIDGRYYTNNAASAPTSISDPIGSGTSSHSPDVLLDSGVTTKIGDHVRTVWHDSTNNLDIIQTVYPVAFGASGQIVISVSVASTQSHFVQGQYLVDDETGVQANPVILNSNSYAAHNFDVHSSDVPSFFLEMQNSITNPGTIGMVYLNDSFAPMPMGLMQPSIVYHIDWDLISDYTFGAPIQNGTTSDMASLIQWPLISAKAGTTEILRFSIGASEAQRCSGSAVAFNFVPSHIVWNDTLEQYSQNPINVLSLIYNSTSGTITSLTATQAASAPLKVTPSTQLNGPSLASGSVVIFRWRDSIQPPSGCNNGSTQAAIAFDASGNGLSSPGLGSCSTNITIDCPPIKTHRPLVTTLSRSGSYDASECNARSIVKVVRDTGSPKMGLESISPVTATNMRVVAAPFQAGDSLVYTVSVIDSMVEGLAIVAITDTGNVTTRDTVRYCTISDRSKPTISRTVPFGTLIIEDIGAWQRGIDTVFITDTANVIISPGLYISGNCNSHVELGIATHDQSPAHFIAHIIDCAGNDTNDPVFFVPGSDGVAPLEGSTNIRVFPNPSTDIFTIELPVTPTNVELLDALGRLVSRFTAQGEYQFEASNLVSGTYFLHAGNSVLRLTKQ